ncbi:MAG: RDD family protein [Propionibacteriaceae bacterium]|nr:RDD family protein [Propionibacteriaceae bacterium]
MNLTPAPWKPRTVAGVIDVGIVFGYVVVLGMVIAVIFPMLTGPTSILIGSIMAILLIEVPIGIWWWRQESTKGDTLGKRFAGVFVVNAATKKPATSAECAIRVIAKLLPWVIVHIMILMSTDPVMGHQWWPLPCLFLSAAIGAASLGSAYVRSDHRAWHDLIAGTQVVSN